MKEFCRSLHGKIILFIVYTVCAALGMASLAAGSILADRNAYSVTAEQFMQTESSRIISDQVQWQAFDYLLENTMDAAGEEQILFISDVGKENVTYYYKSPSYQQSGVPENTEIYIYYLVTVKDELGHLLFSDWLSASSVADQALFAEENEAIGRQVYMVQVDGRKALRAAGVDVLVLRMMVWNYGLRYAVWPICAAAWILVILIFVWLVKAAGHKPGSDVLTPGPLFKVPYDLMVLGYLAILSIGMVFLGETPMNGTIRFVAIGLFFLGMAVLTLGMVMSLASRLKQHMLWHRMLTVRLAKLLFRLLQSIGKGCKRAAFRLPLVWRTIAIIAGISVIEFIMIAMLHRSGALLVLFWLLEKMILVPVILSIVLTMRRLQQAGEAMAAGNLHYQIDTKGMLPDFKAHAVNLGSISEGMTQAVEQRLKSERMKTELITNVSHDIKTPLTSIINYADLITREKPENEKIAEYCEVLTRQSGKLKRLIEDLVEASKASTGNLEVNPVPCDASVFVQQTEGEYEEKLEEAGLVLVTKVPDREIMILADSRRMWRVFDNLMNNVCKYSQSGTRVFLSLEAVEDQAVITFKNVSSQPLDISPDELLERFVRGDSSRNTEGNGLGLSIARSLTELQGGSFDLEVDGDLFKAILRFPIFFITS